MRPCESKEDAKIVIACKPIICRPFTADVCAILIQEPSISETGTDRRSPAILYLANIR